MVLPYVGGFQQCVAVNSSVISNDFVDKDGTLVLRDCHHFDSWLETGTLFLIDYIDFNGVGFCGCCARHGAAEIILGFVAHSHLQVELF